MARISHAVALRDHQYLWNIGPAADMTGGYEDQYDLEKLLKNPTKSVAAKCLNFQIMYWFQKGTEDGGMDQVNDLLKSSPEVRAIYERHVGILDDEDGDEE